MAALFFSASVTPSLYPRPWLAQGVVSGLSLSMGYGLGSAGGALGRRLGRREPRAPRTAGRLTAVVLGLIVPVWALVLNHRWQLDVRALMGVEATPALYPLAVVAVALLTGYAVVVLGRVAGAAHRAYVGVVSRLVPRRGLVAVRIGVPLLLVVVFLDAVVAGRLVSEVRESLVAADARLDAGVARPDTTHRSGGPGSLLPWETHGRMGRRFVAQGPDTDALTLFGGVPAVSPIRVYAGLASAASPRERAELAVAELVRTGAFEREVLVIITPTGTGSVNAFAIDPLEYMYNGNTAAVAMQYSYAPSWLTMAGNQERAKQGARHLFAAVMARLRHLPERSAPTVLLYGESLGSFGSEAVFDDLDDIPQSVEGVLWVGPPRANRLWRQVTADRDTGSPVWQPVYRGGRTVRFGADGASLSEPGEPWHPPRVAYLQHPSDPITWWTTDLLFRRPEWLRDPRPPDVSTAMPYLPVVTFVQTGIDMVLGANAPIGYGHMYGPEQGEAWALIAPSEGWSARDTRRLLRIRPAATDDPNDDP